MQRLCVGSLRHVDGAFAWGIDRGGIGDYQRSKRQWNTMFRCTTLEVV